jgi:hypothetical protein
MASNSANGIDQEKMVNIFFTSYAPVAQWQNTRLLFQRSRLQISPLATKEKERKGKILKFHWQHSGLFSLANALFNEISHGPALNSHFHPSLTFTSKVNPSGASKELLI